MFPWDFVCFSLFDRAEISTPVFFFFGSCPTNRCHFFRSLGAHVKRPVSILTGLAVALLMADVLYSKKLPRTSAIESFLKKKKKS